MKKKTLTTLQDAILERALAIARSACSLQDAQAIQTLVHACIDIDGIKCEKTAISADTENMKLAGVR